MPTTRHPAHPRRPRSAPAPRAAGALTGLLIAALAAWPGASPAAAGAARRTAHAARSGPTVYQSRHLWATVDICNSSRHRHTLGVRGSMPGSGRPGEEMFMRFRAQFLSTSDHQWHYVTSGADSGFRDVGRSTFKARQSGWSFQFLPPAGGAGFTLRGVIDFRWSRGARVIRHARKATTAGHHVTAGADPRGYSAQTCVIR